MLKIGVTGGIGSGKTKVCRIFNALKIPIYSADDRAKSLMTENATLRKSISSLFGEKAYINNTLNRAYIASSVFNDKELLHKLNSIVHPIVKLDFETWVKVQKSPYVIKEAAVLIESGAFKLMDKILLVEAPHNLKLKRVILRDGVESEEVLLRMSTQMSDEEKRKYADNIICNDEKTSLLQQILALHHSFLKD